MKDTMKKELNKWPEIPVKIVFSSLELISFEFVAKTWFLLNEYKEYKGGESVFP